MSDTPASLLRYARAGLRVLAANVRRPAAPWKLNLCLTYWCQYRCKTCNIWKRKPVDELSTDEWLLFIERNRHAAWVDLTGGEIFLRPDIEAILEKIAVDWKQLALLHFPTNGFLTDKIVNVTTRVARKATSDVVVTVSLDGDETLNDEIRGIKGGFQRQMATFSALRKIPRVRAVLGVTLSRFNAGRLQQTFDACRAVCSDLDIDSFHLNVAQTSKHYYGNDENGDVLATADQNLQELAVYRAMRGNRPSPASWLENQYLDRLERFVHDGVTPTRCHALRSTCFVDPWGVVYPCITYAHPVGRLRDTAMDLQPIWDGAQAEALQRDIWAGDCPQCWTACEAYPSILGNALVPGGRRSPSR